MPLAHAIIQSRRRTHVPHTLYFIPVRSIRRFAQQTAAPRPAAPGSPADLVQQGQTLSRDGKQDEALALYSKALDKSPGSV